MSEAAANQGDPANSRSCLPGRVLLADFTTCLGRRLEKILASSPAFRLRIFRFPNSSQKGDRWQAALRRCIRSFRPHLILASFERGFLGQDLEKAGMLDRGPQRRPLLVAVDAAQSGDLLRLLEQGASDFMVPPLRAIDVLARVRRFLNPAGDGKPTDLKSRRGLKQLVGKSEAFRAVVKQIPLIASCSATALISGETGTGKELCARAVHYLSERSDHPFVAVNCGVIPVDLAENELFGHEKAAFTGASSAGEGLIQGAAQGTLFLDEIDCLPLAVQVKLLRFLQEKEYRPLGSPRLRHADVRVVAATNAQPEEAVATGKLRQDLFYRLNIIHLRLPPLRHRLDDIPLLASHLLSRIGAELGKPFAALTSDALQVLSLHDWPGNVRELQNVLERATLLAPGEVIRAADIDLPDKPTLRRQESFKEAKARIVANFERSFIQRLLLTHRGNISHAAQAACKNRRAFWELIRKHGIDASQFKVQ